jgi:hypothetical protein
MPTVTIHTHENLNVSENGAAQPEPKQSSSPLGKFFQADTSVTVWLIFFTIGGGIFALYYAHIGYVPEMEWSASLVYLFIGTLVGGVIGLLLTMSLYLPGLIWSETLVSDPCLKFSYSHPPGLHPGEEPVTELCLRTIFKYLGLPFLVVLSLSHIVLLTGRVLYCLLAGAFLIVTFVVMKGLLKHRALSVTDCNPKRLWSFVWSELKNDVRRVRNVVRKPGNELKLEDTKSNPTIDRHVFKLASAFTLSVLLNQISMYVVYWLSGSPAKARTFTVLTLLCVAAVWIACHIVALRHEKHSRQAIAASLVTAGLLLFTADNFSTLSVKLMNNFGVGYDQQVKLLINAHGKEIVDGLGVPKCGDLQLCNVEILSKVGDHYYLRVDKTVYLTLPKSDVVAMRVLN